MRIFYSSGQAILTTLVHMVPSVPRNTWKQILSSEHHFSGARMKWQLPAAEIWAIHSPKPGHALRASPVLRAPSFSSASQKVQCLDLFWWDYSWRPKPKPVHSDAKSSAPCSCLYGCACFAQVPRSWWLCCSAIKKWALVGTVRAPCWPL